MKKTTFLVLMSLCLSIRVHAQVEMSFLPYAEVELADPVCLLYQLAEKKPVSLYHAGFGCLADYPINNMLSVGMGIEVDGIEYGFCNLMNAVGQMAWTMPIYSNFRVRFGHWSMVPHGELQLGYAIALNKVTALPNWNGEVRARVTEQQWHGGLRAKGFFAGIGLGIDINRHEITVGCKSVPISGNLTNIHTGTVSFQQERAFNIYLRYGYRIGVR